MSTKRSSFASATGAGVNISSMHVNTTWHSATASVPLLFLQSAPVSVSADPVCEGSVILQVYVVRAKRLPQGPKPASCPWFKKRICGLRRGLLWQRHLEGRANNSFNSNQSKYPRVECPREAPPFLNLTIKILCAPEASPWTAHVAHAPFQLGW